jgi:hypothetical protein
MVISFLAPMMMAPLCNTYCSPYSEPAHRAGCFL